MPTSKKKGNLIEADYTEDVVGFAIDSFLSITCFPRRYVTVEPFSRGTERWLGADARIFNEISGFKPFYMQFKRPSAYPDRSTSKIITQRNSLGLEVSPNSLFFRLRYKEKNHSDYQHNNLYRWRNRLVKYAQSDAVYVCPLFLERSAYRFHLHLSALRRWSLVSRDPWEINDVQIRDHGNIFDFHEIPFLAEHVCIPPHALVTNSNHSYSFSESGTDLCFHSPKVIPEGILKFGDWIESLSKGLISENSNENLPYIKLEEAKDKLQKLIYGDGEDNDVISHPEGLFESNNNMAIWAEWGRYLEENYSIKQYMFIIWK